MSTPPTVEQLRNLASRTFAGQLRPEESVRLLEGIELLAARKPPRRSGPPLAAAKRLQRLRRRLLALHAPMERGGMEICRECSGWDGLRCRGLVTPYPCPTVEAIEGARAAADGPQGVQEAARAARDVRGAARAADGRTGPRGEAAA